MGYLMQQVDSDFFVPVDEKRLAYEAVFRYMDSDDAGDFMWVDILMLWDAKTLEDQFAAWRWSTSTDEAGNIVAVVFNGEKLSYDDVGFLQAVAPYVRDGSFIAMRGEDGREWRWEFVAGDCIEREVNPARLSGCANGGRSSDSCDTQVSDRESFYARVMTSDRRFLDRDGVVGALRLYAQCLGGEVVGLRGGDGRTREVPWHSMEELLPQDDVVLQCFALSTIPPLIVNVVWIPFAAMLPCLRGPNCVLEWGLSFNDDWTWEQSERAVIAAIEELGAFWAEINELRVTNGKPSFCGSHAGGIPHLGTANYFGPDYVDRLGGPGILERAGFAKLEAVAGGMYVRMPELRNPHEFELCRDRLEAVLGASNGVFDDGPVSPVTGRRDRWRVVDSADFGDRLRDPNGGMRQDGIGG